MKTCCALREAQDTLSILYRGHVLNIDLPPLAVFVWGNRDSTEGQAQARMAVYNPTTATDLSLAFRYLF